MRFAALVAALGLAAGLLAACGGGDALTTERATPQSVAERSAGAARSAVADEAADRGEGDDAAAALGSAQSDRAVTREVCRRLAEENPDEAAAILEACDNGEAAARSTFPVVRRVVALGGSPHGVGPPYVTMYGTGAFSPLPMRLGPQEHHCTIKVTQYRTDEAAGSFSVTFSGDGLPEQTVEVEGPLWRGEATLPAGGEGLREIRLAVQADAEDAEWRVICSQRSG